MTEQAEQIVVENDLTQAAAYQPAPFEAAPCFKASTSDFALLTFFISAMVLSKQILIELYVAFGQSLVPLDLFVIISNGSIYLFAFMALVKLIKIFRTTCGHRIKVTPHHVEFVQGIATKRSTKINIADIRAIDIEQTAPERLIDVGTIRIASSSTEGYEIEAPGINHPERLRDYLKHRIGVLKYNESPDPNIRY
jgi:membrane protein YdbS with pleckstrin-like domain